MKAVKPLKIKNHKVIFSIGIFAIIAIIGLNDLSKSVYFVNFYKTFISYKIRTNYEIKTIQERQKQAFAVKTTHQDTVPQTIVVIIGESLARGHLSLYGYPRNTNPLLSQRPDSLLYVYKDVVSPQVHTIPVIRSLLSMADVESPSFFTEKPSLFELFNRAGYETYLISNQGFSEQYHSSFDILLSLAKNKYNLAPQKEHDGIILPQIDEILTKNKQKNKLIVVHLIGNHMAYEFRYPKEYATFDYKKDKLVSDTKYRDSNAKKTIDKYDNSVLYNDYIINSVINSLEKQVDERTALVYFSDHGEEMYDYRAFAGHAYEKVSPTMCEIPFMVWLSQAYKQNRPDLVFECERPYSTADFIFSISDIGGLHYEGYDDSRSIFSNKFTPKQRFVGEKKYEDLIEQFKERN